MGSWASSLRSDRHRLDTINDVARCFKETDLSSLPFKRIDEWASFKTCILKYANKVNDEENTGRAKKYLKSTWHRFPTGLWSGFMS